MSSAAPLYGEALIVFAAVVIIAVAVDVVDVAVVDAVALIDQILTMKTQLLPMMVVTTTEPQIKQL